MIVNQGRSAIPPNLLVLGGTTEASALSDRLAACAIKATLSLAGRVANPKHQPLPMRVGGFGGVGGLQRYLRENGITHVIDATHPFASQMSRNAIAACAALERPIVALARPPWQAQHGDIWHRVPDIPGAVAALDRPACRVMLAVGRMHLAAFAPNPQHHYLLRLVDPPTTALPIPDTSVVVDRGPFSIETDKALLEEHKIDLIVSKNSGGTGAVAKIEAARSLNLPVFMIDRPKMPDRTEVTSIDDVLAWLSDHGADLGV